MVTLVAVTRMQPLTSRPVSVVPEPLTVMSPLTTVRLVPAGTPVLLASGKPQELGLSMQWVMTGGVVVGVGDGLGELLGDGVGDGGAVVAVGLGVGELVGLVVGDGLGEAVGEADGLGEGVPVNRSMARCISVTQFWAQVRWLLVRLGGVIRAA